MSEPAAVAPIAAPYLALIPLLPLAGAVTLALGGAALQRRFGEALVGWLACATVGAAFVLSVTAFLQLAGLPPAERHLLADLFPWIQVGSLRVDFAYAADPLTAIALLVVTGIGGLIHVYATGYMHDDPAYWRFFAYLNLFTFAMLTLVMGDNLLLLFLGWEGVGFCSWALIGFWHKELPNTTAGNKAFIVNRIGDFGFVLGIFLLFWSLDAAGHATLSFRELRPQVHALESMTFWGVPVITLATLLLFVGATGKSAQIPLYVWLPDAMAGPTPVSALIHAATMVTAGIYMIGRLHFLFDLAPFTLHVIAVIGAATALLAATIAVAQNDIKKVLAYSTVSQLGYMFLAMGVGAHGAGIFHLMTHAFFKACLFLGAGSVIHAMGGEHDMRKMGGLWSALPSTSKTFLIATLALTGCPFLAGFFSKDEILWQAFSSRHGHWALWLTATLVAGLTAFYMFRQVFMVFFGESRADHHTREHVHESPSVMTVPLWILAIGSIAAGYLGVPHVLSAPARIPHYWNEWLAPVFGGHGPIEEHLPAGGDAALELLLMAISVGVAFAGAGLAYLMYYRGSIRPALFSEAAGGAPYRLVLNKYYVDELYDLIFVRGALLLSRAAAWFDLHVIDGIVNLAAVVVREVARLGGFLDNLVVDGAVNAVAEATWVVGGRIRRIQTGAISAYLYVVVLGVLGGVFLWWSWAVASL